MPPRLQRDLNYNLTYRQINDQGGAFLGMSEDDEETGEEMRIFPNLVIFLPKIADEEEGMYFLEAVRKKLDYFMVF